MTRSEMKLLYLDYLDDPSGGYFTNTVTNLRLNLAQRELQKRLISANKQYYTKCVKTNTAVDQAAYALPSDFIQVIRLERVISGSGDTAVTQSIEPQTPNQKDRYEFTAGDPLFYTFDKNNIILYPAPSTVVELRLTYSYLVADIASDSDEPDAPEQFHEYIPVLAARDSFLKDSRPITPIQEKLKEYEKLLAQIATQRNMDKPRMVVSTDGGFG